MAFGEKILTWNIYTTNKALPTTKQVQLIDPKAFVIATLDAESEIFVGYVAIQEQKEMPVHSKKQAQVGALLFDKAQIEVLAEYSNYGNVFSAENVTELP